MISYGSQIVQFQLHTDSWTPIIAPMPCAYFLINGNSDGSAMLRCTNTDDPASCYTMPPGGWFSFSSPALYQRFRFTKGQTVAILRATQAGTIVYLEFFN
jgi:hypothetical protein